MTTDPLISKDALQQAMASALKARSADARSGITESDIVEFVEIIYRRSLDDDSSRMKKEISKFLEKASGGQ